MKIYNSIFTFKEDGPIKKMTGLFERRIICEENEWTRYELLKCLKIHKMVFYRHQHFKDEHRPIKHSCKK